jgi:hypothetical protein
MIIAINMMRCCPCGGNLMLIQVIYHDDAHDRIESHTLSHLIREGRIKAFRRASGWAYVGRDRIRKFDHVGQERLRESLTQQNDRDDLTLMKETGL